MCYNNKKHNFLALILSITNYVKKTCDLKRVIWVLFRVPLGCVSFVASRLCDAISFVYTSHRANSFISRAAKAMLPLGARTKFGLIMMVS